MNCNILLQNKLYFSSGSFLHTEVVSATGVHHLPYINSLTENITIAREEISCRHYVGYYFVCTILQRGAQTTAFVNQVVEHWLERAIVQCCHYEGLMRRPIAPLLNTLPRSYISFPYFPVSLKTIVIMHFIYSYLQQVTKYLLSVPVLLIL